MTTSSLSHLKTNMQSFSSLGKYTGHDSNTCESYTAFCRL